MTTKKLLLKHLEEIPENLLREILNFTLFLKSKDTLPKSEQNTPEPFSFPWEGGLKELKCTSVELQHRAKEWR